MQLHLQGRGWSGLMEQGMGGPHGRAESSLPCFSRTASPHWGSSWMLCTQLPSNETGGSQTATSSKPGLLAALQPSPHDALGQLPGAAPHLGWTTDADAKCLPRCHQEGVKGSSLARRPRLSPPPSPPLRCKGQIGSLALNMLWTLFSLGGPLIR